VTIFTTVLDIKKIENLDFFKIIGDKHHIYVSNVFVDYYKAKKTSGWEFEEVKLSKNGSILHNESIKRKEKNNAKSSKKRKLTVITPDDLEEVDVYNSDGKKIYIKENSKRKQRFIIVSKNNRNSNIDEYQVRYILTKLWNYSKTFTLNKGSLVSIDSYNNGEIFYGQIDEYEFNYKMYLRYNPITKKEYDSI